MCMYRASGGGGDGMRTVIAFLLCAAASNVHSFRFIYFELFFGRDSCSCAIAVAERC